MLNRFEFLFVLLLLTTALVASEPSIGNRHEDSEAPKRFTPGIRIDWRNRTVELEAEVALRDGPVELLVCSSNTREHESVFVVRARPMHVFQALGILGLQTGEPARYDKEQDRVLPPSGDPVEIRIRFLNDSADKLHHAEHFLRNARDHKRPDSLRWVFVGSRLLPDGRFAADDDGTIACVVDFDSALIALDTSHSADNELLWLEANPETIPKRGTPCTLFFSAPGKAPSRLTVNVDSEGRLTRDGTTVSIDSVAKIVQEELRGGVVILQIRPGVSADVVTGVRRKLVDAGVDAGRILESTEAPTEAGPESPAGNP